MLAGAKIMFWLFLLIAGPWGAYLILTEKIKPWYWARRGADDFRKKINFYVLGLVVICLIYSGLYYLLGAVQLLLATAMWALVFSAAYFSVWLLKKIMIKARVELRLLGLGVVGVLLILLVVTIFKDVIFVDMSRSTIRKELHLSAETPKHEMFYREYNRFYFTAQTPFELKLVGPDEQELFKFQIAPGDDYPAYEFDKTGTLILSLDPKTSVGGLVVYTLERGFSWKRFALRNYPLYRYLTLFLFFLWALLYFSPQKMLKRKDDDMTNIEIDKIALIKDLNLTLRRDRSDQNMLVAWYENVRRQYGHKVNMVNLAMQIEDIELQTKALQALREYNRQGVALNEDLKVGDHSEIKAQIEKKRLEMEMSELELKIERNKMAIREVRTTQEEKESAKKESEIDRVLRESVETTRITLANMTEISKKVEHANDLYEQLKTKYGQSRADQFLRILSDEGIINISGED